MKKNKSNDSTFSAFGFIMTILGAAVGLGSIWGFPTKMNNHGIIFLIPFAVALILCGGPIFLIEMTLGNKYRKNHVLIFDDLIKRGGRFFGYLQSAATWILSIVYSTLVAWSVLALVMSFLPGLDKQSFFQDVILAENNKNPQNFSQLGSISIWVLLAMIFVWFAVYGILIFGVTSGIDKANKIFIPSLFFIFVAILIYTFTLFGSIDGINKMFELNITKLSTAKIWSDSFNQAFFMLATCTGVVIIFSSSSPKNQDNTTQYLTVVLGLIIIALISSITVFNIMGVIAKKDNLPIDKIMKKYKGPTLIFNVLPQFFAIVTAKTNWFIFSRLIAILFFVAVFFAGISSLIAVAEAAVNPIIHDLKINRHKVLPIFILISFLISLLFVFNNSGALLDGFFIWVAGIWQMAMSIIELIGFALLWNCYDKMATFNNQNSWFKFDKYIFRVLCLFVVPLVIIVNLILAIYEITQTLEINRFSILVGTLGSFFGVLVLALICTNLNKILLYLNYPFTKLKKRKQTERAIVVTDQEISKLAVKKQLQEIQKIETLED